MNNAQRWLASLTPEQRREHCRAAARKNHKPYRFRDGDDAAKEAGRLGGLETAKRRLFVGKVGCAACGGAGYVACHVETAALVSETVTFYECKPCECARR